MYKVYEVFEDGKRFKLFESDDKFTCEVWMRNHEDCTNALRIGNSKLVLEGQEV